MEPDGIRRNLDDFQNAIEDLSAALAKVSELWSDEKFKELSDYIGELASDSKDVLVSGDRCCDSVMRFKKWAEEG